MTRPRNCLLRAVAALLTGPLATTGLPQPEADSTSLDRLSDIVEPLPAPWWPPAPGWRWVAVFAAIGLVATGILVLIRRRQDRYRREARAELVLLKARLQEHDPVARAAAMTALAGLLKRVAPSRYARPEVVMLAGPSWFRFLDHRANEPLFAPGLAEVLERATCDPDVVARLDHSRLKDLLRAVRRWIDHHPPLGREERRP